MKKRIIQLMLVICALTGILTMTVAAEATIEPTIEMTKNGEGVTVTTENVPEGSLLYFASYTANVQMLGVEVVDANAADKNLAVAEGTAYSKAFLTDADRKAPISEAANMDFRIEIPAHIFDFGAQQVVTYDPGDYGNDFVPREQVPSRWYANKIGSKVYPPEDSYTIKYKLHGSNEYESGAPIDAGTYDVTITRPGDGTYAAFEHTYEEVLVIEKAKHGPMALQYGAPIISDKSYTWMELELDWTGAERPYEGATVTFYLTRDQVQYQYSEPFQFSYTEPNTAVIHFAEYDAANFLVGVMVTDDRNFEDFTYHKDYGYTDKDGNWVKYELLPYPNETWLQHEMACDTQWYYSGGPEYTISTGAELAGLAYLVNVAGITFEGETIKLDADVSVVGDGYKWAPIGSSGTNSTVTPFKGTFDGQGHTVSDMFIQNDERYAGLFGYLDHATVKNLTVADSQVQVQYNGGNSVGSIAGYADVSEILNCSSDAKVGCLKEDGRVGGIVGYADLGKIENCSYSGRIEAMGNAGGIVGEADGAASLLLCTFEGEIICPRPNAGGIVGKLSSAMVTNCIGRGYIESGEGVGGIVGRCVNGGIVNCIHYGTITYLIDGRDGVGGIVGIVDSGMVYNCVNAYGSSVRGYSCVGGIVGLNESEGEVYNCYSAGKVKGTSDYGGIFSSEKMYAGAIVGRNKNDKGWVTNCYYLQNSASNLKGYVGGSGTKDGSEDSATHVDIGYFQGWSTNVEGYWYENSTESGKASLVTILNRWQRYYATNGFGHSVRWVTSEEGYPIPKIGIQ